jgi:hypothetical protein
MGIGTWHPQKVAPDQIILAFRHSLKELTSVLNFRIDVTRKNYWNLQAHFFAMAHQLREYNAEILEQEKP